MKVSTVQVRNHPVRYSFKKGLGCGPGPKG
jgi:hypothetical protein